MKILVQPEFKEKIINPLFEIKDSLQAESLIFHYDVIVGDQNFFLRHPVKNIAGPYRILISDLEPLKLNDLGNLINLQANYIYKPDNMEELQFQLIVIHEKLLQKNKALVVSKEIQKKRKELEELNARLSSESEVQFFSLEKSNSEEMQKNLNEKSLLYFLDFISSESLNDDFVSQILKLIWKELKKMGYAYQIGFCFQNLNQSISLISYNGILEKSEILKLNIEDNLSSTLLATAMGRPVGKILSWKLSEFSRTGYFFVETIDQQFLSQQVEAYFKERLFTLSLYFDRWLIEKEYHVLIERWDQTFQSFSGPTHVIDENFVIHQSNYIKKSSQQDFCYKILAGRDQPCGECPVLNKATSEFFLKTDKKVRVSLSEFIHVNKKYYFMLYEDLTNLDLLKSKMIQSEKMATVGRLGNHLSHELNNPLTGLKLYTQFLLSSEKDDSLSPSLRSDLAEVLKATERCEKIIKNLLQFSQQSEIELKPISFTEVLDSTITLLKTALRPHRLFIDLRKSLISADFTGVQQILFNILKNSCQAMEGPGSIKIFEMETAAEIIFCIQDSGPGLLRDVQKNLFSPFMTSKKVGEGTGLGLYLSKKLMQRMNADIRVNDRYKNGLQIDLVFKK